MWEKIWAVTGVHLGPKMTQDYRYHFVVCPGKIPYRCNCCCYCGCCNCCAVTVMMWCGQCCYLGEEVSRYSPLGYQWEAILEICFTEGGMLVMWIIIGRIVKKGYGGYMRDVVVWLCGGCCVLFVVCVFGRCGCGCKCGGKYGIRWVLGFDVCSYGWGI